MAPKTCHAQSAVITFARLLTALPTAPGYANCCILALCVLYFKEFESMDAIVSHSIVTVTTSVAYVADTIIACFTTDDSVHFMRVWRDNSKSYLFAFDVSVTVNVAFPVLVGESGTAFQKEGEAVTVQLRFAERSCAVPLIVIVLFSLHRFTHSTATTPALTREMVVSEACPSSIVPVLNTQEVPVDRLGLLTVVVPQLAEPILTFVIDPEAPPVARFTVFVTAFAVAFVE